MVQAPVAPPLLNQLAALAVALAPVVLAVALGLAVVAWLARRRHWSARRMVFTTMVLAVACAVPIYFATGWWLVRYGMAAAHLVRLCGPGPGARIAWDMRSGGGLNANEFFFCGTGLHDPSEMCIRRR